MEIKVLGSCCAGCKAFQQRVDEVVLQMNLDATVIKIDDIVEILNHKILSLPGLIIDGEIVSMGKSLTKEEMRAIFNYKLGIRN